MMSASREGRQSEKTFGQAWDAMRRLAVTLWIPRADEAQEEAAYLKRLLDQMVAEMKAEAFTNPPSYGQHGPYPERLRSLVDTCIGRGAPQR